MSWWNLQLKPIFYKMFVPFVSFVFAFEWLEEMYGTTRTVTLARGT